MSHTCRAALLKCMDFRLGPKTCQFLNEKGLSGDTDMISVAGAAKDIAANPEGFVMEQVKLSVGLHSINTLYIMHHSDCGAYGGASKFESPEAELEMHKDEMKKAVNVIKAAYPELEIELLYAKMTEDNSVESIETIYLG